MTLERGLADHGPPKLSAASSSSDATLTGPESRGSVARPHSRAMIRRVAEPRRVAGLYPCGEGAGYAGGIISAAVDGLRTARAIAARYAPGV